MGEEGGEGLGLFVRGCWCFVLFFFFFFFGLRGWVGRFFRPGVWGGSGFPCFVFFPFT